VDKIKKARNVSNYEFFIPRNFLPRIPDLTRKKIARKIFPVDFSGNKKRRGIRGVVLAESS
jgi:hypothetical protein